MGSLSPMHWLIVVGVLALLFGARRLPDVARSVGQSARLFKGEMKGLRSDDDPAPDERPSATATSGSSVTAAGSPAIDTEGTPKPTRTV